MKHIRLTQETLDHWAEMTNYNNHIEVRIEIAEFFNICQKGKKYLDFASAWKQYKTVCEHAQREALTASCILCECMMDEIRAQYGDEIADKVERCL